MNDGFDVDKLLWRNVKQLREIDQRIEDILKWVSHSQSAIVHPKLCSLRDDLARMIREAEAEYEAF